MIDRGSAKVPVKRQAELLDLSRSSVYYTPRPLPENGSAYAAGWRANRAAP